MAHVGVVGILTCYDGDAAAVLRKDGKTPVHRVSSMATQHLLDGAARTSEAHVAIWDRFQRKTKACMRVRRYTAFHISPNISGKDC